MLNAVTKHCFFLDIITTSCNVNIRIDHLLVQKWEVGL